MYVRCSRFVEPAEASGARYEIGCVGAMMQLYIRGCGTDICFIVSP